MTANAEDLAPVRTPVVAWAGYGIAGAGVVVLAAGGYFGTQTQASTSPSTTQPEARRLNQDARQAADRANLCLLTGTGLVAAGVGLWALERFVLAQATVVSVALLPTPGGGLSLQGRF